jgi:DNA-directed RNA polymerase
MGADICRGLLVFAQQKPLGAKGLFWLKVHLANMMGKDKVFVWFISINVRELSSSVQLSFDGRVAYVDEHISDVYDSADAPLTGRRWWLSGDNPWQALAACAEIAAALRFKYGPINYPCGLPIQQDGSCNGLQHYAALGRDEEGARAVNLLPPVEAADVGADKPADVYSRVLGIALKRLEADIAHPAATAYCETSDAPKTLLQWLQRTRRPADSFLDDAAPVPSPANGDAAGYKRVNKLGKPKAQPVTGDAELDAAVERRLTALFLAGRVDRKVVKQTVMTSVYGVTLVGARAQIQARLMDKLGPAGENLGVEELDLSVPVASLYLAKTTLSSLGDLFSSADAIKGWLTTAARMVGNTGHPMAWVTPLGLPVMQPYRQDRDMVVHTALQNVIIADTAEQMPVNTRRQASAFPPNYVHSLDSTHMMLTALECAAKGITFAAVHDSYWTHAATAEEMNASLRRQFVALYSQPLLEQLRTDLKSRFPRVNFPELPARGQLVLEDVVKSKYFFS